jgi:hypothetical protein
MILRFNMPSNGAEYLVEWVELPCPGMYHLIFLWM